MRIGYGSIESLGPSIIAGNKEFGGLVSID